MYTAPTYEAKTWWNDWHWNDSAALRSFVVGIEGAWGGKRSGCQQWPLQKTFSLFAVVYTFPSYAREDSILEHPVIGLCPSPWRVIGGVLSSASHVTRYERRRHELLRLADSITAALGGR